ncbi:MAG: hypothetical protein ACT6FG_06725 [Methanosarcinaceae archaeon]
MKLSSKLESISDRNYQIGFWCFIGVSLIQFLIFKYAPSLDGPQHLHNAYVIRDLISGKGLVRDFYSFNPQPVGYWSTHLILSLFSMIFPPWLAEKLLLISYVIGVSLAYRYFLRSLKLYINPVAQFLIFPLIPSFFLLAGYYAFSFGIMLLLVTYGYWNRVGRDFSWRSSLKFAVLLLCFYFTHGVVFVFFIATFVIQYIHEMIIAFVLNADRKKVMRQQATKTLRTFAAFVPAMIFLFIYTNYIHGANAAASGDPKDTRELLELLIRIRPIIAFDHNVESVATKPLFFVLLLVLITVFVRQTVRLQQRKTTIRNILLNRSTVYLFIALLFLCIYFMNPDRIISGSMTQRISFFFFLFLIMWIPFNRIPLPVSYILGVVLFFSVAYNQMVMPKFYYGQVKLINALQELDDHIEEGATIITLKESRNWTHHHFGMYTGLGKHLVNLNNPQCYGPFPIVWDQENSSAVFAGDHQINVAGLGRLNPKTNGHMQVDYIVIFYYDQFLKNPDNESWLSILSEYYNLVEVAAKGAVALYKVNPILLPIPDSE